MPPAVTVYLSLGSNLGDRLENLRSALRLLSEQQGIELRRASSVYKTEPVDYTDQGWFLNCAAEINTVLEPLELLHTLQRIERELGRRRTIPKGPRTIDLDILLYGDAVFDSEELTIPHPRLLERRFVLEPLRELAPHLVITGTSATVEGAYAHVRDTAAVRLFAKPLCA